MKVLFKRQDGTFVAEVNGYPYHVTHDDPLFPEAKKAGANAPFEPEPPSLDIGDLRAVTAIPKADFANVLADLGVLEDAEAIALAQGQWPKSMASFLDYLDERQRRDAQIAIAACDTFERMHPFVLSLASWLGMKDETVDALFGIGVKK